MLNTIEQQLKILIIEDNEGDFIMIEDLLIDHNPLTKIHRAATYKEALDLIHSPKYSFNIIILDLSLPDAKGETLVVDILDKVKNIPIIILTGYTDKSFITKALSMGISDYILKDELSETQLNKAIIYSIERKKANIQLRESEENYRTLFYLSPIPMWVYDLETLQFLNVNDSALRHYGYAKDEFLKLKINQLYSDTDLSSQNILFNPFDKNSLLNFKGNYKHKKKNGETIAVQVFEHEITYDFRKAAIMHVHDITAQLQTISKTQQLLEITATQNTKIKSFAYTISHNIKSHSANLSGLADALFEAPTEMEKIFYINMLKSSTAQLENTLKNLNDIISESNYSLPKEKKTLRVEVDKTLKILNNIIHTNHIKIDNQVDDAIKITVVPAYLDSILLNIISNAVRYRCIDKTPEIKITTAFNGKFVSLSIKDNGLGIDLKKYSNDIFQMHQKFHNNSDAQGFGLYISKNQIETMGGYIEVESEENIGSNFRIHFKK